MAEKRSIFIPFPPPGRDALFRRADNSKGGTLEDPPGSRGISIRTLRVALMAPMGRDKISSNLGIETKTVDGYMQRAGMALGTDSNGLGQALQERGYSTPAVISAITELDDQWR